MDDAKLLLEIKKLIKNEFEIHDEKWEEKILSWKSEIMDAIDTFAIEVKDNREYREINSHQTVNNTRRIENLEKKTFGTIIGNG